MKYRPTTQLLFALTLLALTTLLAACDSGTQATPTIRPTASTAIPPTVAAAPANTQPPSIVGPADTATATASANINTNIGTTGIPAATASPTNNTNAVATPAPTGTLVDTAAVTPPATPDESHAFSPTPDTTTANGQSLTALQALAILKVKALAWQPEARLVMLSNVRPGQASKLLGVALGDPNVNEPTPDGKGKNWALIAFSPSTKGAMAFSMDGSQADLVKEGALTDNMVQGFSSPGMAALELSKLDTSSLIDSDKLPPKAGALGSAPALGVALLAPNGLGLGPLPTPTAGGSAPAIAYELFSSDPAKQAFIFFDATTGQVTLDSTTP